MDLTRIDPFATKLRMAALLALMLALLIGLAGWDNFTLFLIGKPLHIFEIALGFGMLSQALATGRRFRPQSKWMPCFFLAVVWLLYGGWECYATAERWDIRVDLLFGWPLLFAGTLWGLAISLRSIMTPERGVAQSGSD